MPIGNANLTFEIFFQAAEIKEIKGSKTKRFCLWTDLADFLTQSSLGEVDVKYEVREPLLDPQSNFEL